MKPRPRAALLVFLLGAACYANTLGNGFVWDDHSTVEDNAFIHRLSNARDILRPDFLWKPRWEIQNQARPAWILSAMLDWALWRDRAWGHHLTSVLLHAANGALFYSLLCAAGAPGQVALWAAALFAVHPIHAEPVCVVSYREDLLAAFFCLLSLMALHRSRRDRRWRKHCYAGALLAFFLALMSKEMAVTLPFAWLLLDAVVLSGAKKALAPRRLALGLPFLLLLGHYLWFHSIRFNYRPILAQTSSVAPPPSGTPAVSPVYTERLVSARVMTVVLSDYLRQLSFPVRLCADYKIRIPAWRDPALLGSAAVVLAALALAAYGCVRLPWLGFGLAWFFLSLAPVSNLVPILNLRADRYLYLPSLGFCLAAAAILDAAASRAKRPLGAAAALIVLLCGFRTALRNRDWRSDLAIFENTSRCAADNERARYNFGVLLQRQGRCEEAVREYRAAEALNPGRSLIRLNLGACCAALGRPKEAEEYYLQGLALAPDSWDLLNNLAGLYFASGRCGQGIPLYRRMLAARPEDPIARNSLGVCYARAGNLRLAAGEFSAALAAHPDYQKARDNLREVRARMKGGSP